MADSSDAKKKKLKKEIKTKKRDGEKKNKKVVCFIRYLYFAKIFTRKSFARYFSYFLNVINLVWNLSTN